MKKASFKLFILMLCTSIVSYAQKNNVADAIENKKFNPAALLWYTEPAATWEEAISTGNGRLGAMVFGKYNEERIQLNEDNYWSGGPYSSVVNDGYKTLPTIQKLVFEGQYLEAHNLFGRNLMGYPVEQQKYQSLGNLHLFFKKEDSVSNYKRWLDKAGEPCTIEMKPNLRIVSNGKQIKFKHNTNGTASFNTIAGQTYSID